MPRKPKKKTIKNKLDKAWRDLVKIQANQKCEVCGKRESLNSHHIIGRRNQRLRWELFNGVCLCAGCHVFKLQSAHQNPVWFNEWLEKNRWDDLQDCKQMSMFIYKPTIDELQEKLNQLNAIIEHESIRD